MSALVDDARTDIWRAAGRLAAIAEKMTFESGSGLEVTSDNWQELKDAMDLMEMVINKVEQSK